MRPAGLELMERVLSRLVDVDLSYQEEEIERSEKDVLWYGRNGLYMMLLPQGESDPYGDDNKGRPTQHLMTLSPFAGSLATMLHK
jgi:hypothetical protein